ncbi:hypothetical protein BV210_06625 [Halorientalis sp. IM1011]|uniref:carboxypeptidase regulatory-like domain-containing protein n=1 Tax=Halorientalis sp. IM1011 TaxID=1932360 RepID=UPI00097CD521|nr:carboxypeptidase regulatory-like domain-containing protein [Halorientalis sp. IM1011]AQL42407.1 hypothetical protein BV210_06625 [Halorientalis sp. IM1011]
MGFDKGTITNGTVVTISLLAIVGLLLVGATPAAALANETTDDGPPEFDFNIDDGANFGFDGDNSSADEPTFDFGDVSDESSFDFGGIGDNGDAPDFSGIGDNGDAPDFGGIGDNGEAPDFSGIGDNGDAPDFGGIGDNGEAPDFGGIGGDDGDDGDDGQNGGDGNETAPANFQVSVDSTNSPVTEGETLTVDATVENTGDESGTQTVQLLIDGSEADSQDVNLNAGETGSVSLSWATTSGDAGDHTATVSTEDGDASTSVTVNAPDTTGTVEGTVSDASGSAIDGATVSAGSQSTTTSADGSYTLTLDAGDYTVEASAQGYNTSSQDVTVTAGETTTADFTLSESVTTGTVEGTVVNVSSGNGIDGATVSAGSQSTTTSADGSYTLTLDAGDYTVEATAEGYNTSSQDVTVTAGETTTANFNLESTDSGTPQYQSFTAYTESGYLQVGTNDLRSELPDCPNGEPENESKGCVKFTADLDPDTGDYTVQPENFHFPPIPFDDTTLGTVMANNTAADTITGNIDIESGTGSFSAPIKSYLEDPLFADTCALDVNVQGTTGTSGDLTGDPGALQPNGTARATVVDGTFSIPKTTSEVCGSWNSTINSDVGLPAGSGENEIVQNLYIVFHEEPVSEVTSGN